MAIQRKLLADLEGALIYVQHDDVTMQVTDILVDNPTRFKVVWSIQDLAKRERPETKEVPTDGIKEDIRDAVKDATPVTGRFPVTERNKDGMLSYGTLSVRFAL